MSTGTKTLQAEILEWLYGHFRYYGALHAAGLLHRLKITSNQVTVSRPLFVFVFAALQIFQPPRYHWLSILAYLLFAYTDLVDGVMAQVYEQKVSDWGTLGDSFADKVLYGSVFWFYRGEFPALVWFTLGGEAFQAALVILFKVFAKELNQVFSFEKIRANIWGKTKGFLQFTTGLLMMVSATTPSQAVRHWVAIIGWTAFSFLVISILAKVKKIAG